MILAVTIVCSRVAVFGSLFLASGVLQFSHVIRLTTYNPEETYRELRTTGILCLTDDVESLQIGEKITIFGRYYKERAYVDLAVDDSHIQQQFVRFCKWER